MIGLATAFFLSVAEPVPLQYVQAVGPIEIILKNGKTQLRTLRVKRGDDVTFTIASDRKIILHLHGYNIERTAEPDAPAIFSFTANATGRFSMEEHIPDAGKKSHSHGPAVLYLEVLPK